MFSIVEAYYGNSMPLFVKDNDRFDISISMHAASVLELVLFLMVLGAIAEDGHYTMDEYGGDTSRYGSGSVSGSSHTSNGNGNINTNSNVNANVNRTSGVLYRSTGSSSSKEGGGIPSSTSELKAIYFFRCERVSADSSGGESKLFNQRKDVRNNKIDSKLVGNVVYQAI